jgi:hypothetical protein
MNHSAKDLLLNQWSCLFGDLSKCQELAAKLERVVQLEMNHSVMVWLVNLWSCLSGGDLYNVKSWLSNLWNCPAVDESQCQGLADKPLELFYQVTYHSVNSWLLKLERVVQLEMITVSRVGW